MFKTIIEFLTKLFDFIKGVKKNKVESDIKKQETKIDSVLSSGTLDELLKETQKYGHFKEKLEMLAYIILFLYLCSGCVNTDTVTVVTTSAYEGRYTAKDEIIINGAKAEISTGSVWVLSDSTLGTLIGRITRANPML